MDNTNIALAATVAARLQTVYGTPVNSSTGDPLDQLVATILSQHTADVNSHRAYANLRAALPTWDLVHVAPVPVIVDLIRVGGLARVKAERIKACLEEIVRRRGRLDLSFLADQPVDQAMAFLRSLPGVGPKTAACILLCACARPVLPVDTHVHRVAGRLGLIARRTTAEQAQPALESLIAPSERHAVHVLLIQHGREVCHARDPRCAVCPLGDVCRRVGVGSSD
ncbi:MAG: endonuclease III [Chloroflexi bacterium]|nr:endonuclease III [Chloroflexota bacterium]